MVEAAGMCLVRLMAIQPSFAACGSGPPLRSMRIGVPTEVLRTSVGRTRGLSSRPTSPNKKATARVAFLFGGAAGILSIL